MSESITPKRRRQAIDLSTIDVSRVHMVGIGGAGMSGLARILLDRGSVVSGSDAKNSRVIMALTAAGASVAVGHSEDNLTLSGQLPTVVVTSFAAIPDTNPELVAARHRGIPVICRSDLLALLMRDYRQILIAGTHGKTSTTSMAVVAFQAAGADPSFAIGGQLNKAGTNAHQGTGKCFIAEADESDASLLSYSPSVAVITNIEPDHLDFFGTDTAYYEVFDKFCDRVVDGGCVVVCMDDARAVSCGLKAAARGITVVGYGTRAAVNATPDIDCPVVIESTEPHGTSTRVTATVLGQTKTWVVHVPGNHMVLNSAAAVTCGVRAGINIDQLAGGISDFTGVRRRFELKARIAEGPARGSAIFDDYAHHPTEVAAVLRATTTMERGSHPGPVIAVFQPHLYSRTQKFAQKFAEALAIADKVVILDVYPAREQPIEGVTGRLIADQPALAGRVVYYEPVMSNVAERVAEIAEPNSVILTIGAGSVTVLGDEIAAELESRAAESSL